jgi:SAM-dependent methyltransferase
MNESKSPIIFSTIGRHLDLGCGSKPRNPYFHSQLYGCDVRDPDNLVKETEFNYSKVNLATQKIPYPDNFFDSVSAFDFIEHIPRIGNLPDGSTDYPFINLMDEIYRVLCHGGIFVAATPAFPNAQAFQDPTHVNIITDKTHEYFSGDFPKARMYGFKGNFLKKTVEWGVPKNAHNVLEPKWRKIYRNFEHVVFKSGKTHLIWELIAMKK